ncbi:augmin complex subunit msd5 [Drosophila pseudoobscura]|uniref:Augmin complex subunit msd5 n=1 Tax=Drosophila pseudoobscura pseudoobscura TaxID=46245 RepID=A0A6I8UAI4_DROPS|nr:augmin complex subunit msd5 [Drosophila pseudoobscura]
MEANTDFSQFCAKLKNENYVKHVKALRDLCVTKSVMKPTTFFESLPKMMEEEAAKVPPSKELGTVADYAELFKSLDEYPSNLQKIPKKRETQRAASLEQPELAEGMKRLEEHRSAAEVYNEFKGFQRKLAKAYEEAAALQKEEAVYIKKLAQLQTFSQQIEKLMPTEAEAPPDAFTADEEQKLMAIAESMKQLNYLRSNRLQLPHPSDVLAGGSLVARLEMFVEVLTFTLMQICSYTAA